MEKILNHLRIQAALGRGEVVQTKIGLVDGYDPKTHCCKVRLQPEDPDNPAATLTGWIPVSSVWAGNGFGIFAPPGHDQAVLVHFVDGDIDSGVISCGVFNDLSVPLQVPQGECWVVHKGGASLRFLNDGTILTTGTLNHDGDLNVTGDVSDAKGSMQTMRDQHNAHTHTGDGAANPPGPTSSPVSGRME